MGPPREDHRRVEIPQAERQVGGRLLSAGLALGSAAGAISWAVNDVPMRSDAVAAIGTAAGVLLALVCLRVRWDRRSSALLAFPAVAAVVLIALGCWNTGGADSPYTGWYLVSSVAGAYFLDRRGTFLLAGAVLVAGLLPFLYEEHHSRLAISHYLLYCGFGAAVAVAFQRQRHRARAAALRAEELADQDPLTGVANRRGFERRVSAEVSRARRGDGTFAVLLIDLDRFKQLNDGAGHAAGDEALRRVALAISGAIRGMDVAARWGGDEFAVLLADVDGTAAGTAVTRIVAAIERIGDAGAARGLPLSASVGLALHPHDGCALDELMESADRRLRRVKGKRARDRARV